MKQILLALFLFSVTLSAQQTEATRYAQSIKTEDLKKLLYVYASDYFQGRETGTIGQQRAADFIRDFYKHHHIDAAKGTNDYYQKMILDIKGDSIKTENVVAFIKGREFPDEYVILSSHLDHIGQRGDVINNGADDNGSGTVSMLEIAEAFQKAVKDSIGPRRSIIFLHVTGEEKGLYGSKYYVDNPLYPLNETIADLNIDMVGRTDPKRTEGAKDYIYLIGSDKLSQELHDLSEEVNKKTVNIELDYTYNAENDPNRFYYRSDHYNFAKNNIPIIFYFNGTHEDYHRSTDEVEKIEFDLLQKRAQLVFYTAWEIANRDKKVELTPKEE